MDVISKPINSDEEWKSGTLFQRTLEELDFYVIRQRLAEHITFSPARKLALSLTPSNQLHVVAKLQRETSEGRFFLDQADQLNLHTVSDPTVALSRADLGGVLTGLELLSIVDYLAVQMHVRSVMPKKWDRVPLLAAIVKGIPDLEELHRQIRICIDDNGDVSDDASSTVRTLRIQMRRAYEHVTEELTRIIQSSVGREALQDQVISIRGERLVVQVKTEMRHRVPGIVLDASKSGSTLFIEPFSTVELCNRWRELAFEEEREVRRVLSDISALVGKLVGDIRRGIDLIAQFDLILARSRYGLSIRGVNALLQKNMREDDSTFNSGASSVRLINAKHPIIGESAVPINVAIGPEWSVLVISGPNTGGKTVAMKTVGILALMNQSGLQIPADEGSSLPVFCGIYTDVGDRQSIEQSMSTFSSHVSNVVEILEMVVPESLVLIDEIGTSTDPEEGSAIAKAILGCLASMGVSTIATTHYRNVAMHVEVSPGMMNASVQLSQTTLQPTYHLSVGIPGRSYAMAVASRLGLPKEIIKNAQALMDPQNRRFEDWLDELQDKRNRLQKRLQESEKVKSQVDALRQNLKDQLDYLQENRKEILDRLHSKYMAHYEKVKLKLLKVEASLSWDSRSGDLNEAKIEVSKIKEELEAHRIRTPEPPSGIEQIPLTVGDYVFVKGLNLYGTVSDLGQQDGRVEVKVGNARLRVELIRLAYVQQKQNVEQPHVQLDLNPGPLGTELDLRGLRAGEALEKMENFLDKAVSRGLGSVRVIHGQGSGTLRNAVRERLSDHPLSKSFAPESLEQSRDGTTIVELA